MDKEQFQGLIVQVTEAIRGKPLDKALEEELNNAFPAGGGTFEEIRAACHVAIKAGWMCDREGGGTKYGRVIKPSDETAGFSVDVVHMADHKGPHHGHPTGEIDMVMPISEGAEFDGYGAGWCVYEPGSAHHPTVSGGEALVLYLLPDGVIDFS